MTRWTWGYLVYGVWIAAFLPLELLGLYRRAPWVTLSETSWHVESTYRFLFPSLLFGFLLGLSVHIRFRVPFWRAMAFGLCVAVASYLIPKLPK